MPSLASAYKAWGLEMGRKNLQRRTSPEAGQGPGGQRREHIRCSHRWEVTEEKNPNVSEEGGNRRTGRQLAALARAVLVGSQEQSQAGAAGGWGRSEETEAANTDISSRKVGPGRRSE